MLALLATLVGVIAIVAEVNAATVASTDTAKHEFEPNKSGFSKGVIIFNPSPEIEPIHAFHNPGVLLNADCVFKVPIQLIVRTRAQVSGSIRHFSGRGHLVGQERMLGENAIYPPPNVECWSVAAVFHNDRTMWRNAISGVAMEVWRDGQVRAQLALSGMFGHPDRVLSGIRASDRGPVTLASKEQSPKQRNSAADTKYDLDFGKVHALFRGVRHPPLLAQVGLFMTLGLMAFWILPIGIDWTTQFTGRRRRVGISLLTSGLLSVGLTCGFVLLA